MMTRERDLLIGGDLFSAISPQQGDYSSHHITALTEITEVA